MSFYAKYAPPGSGGGGGSGNVTGPASSTDNAVVRFDGTTGQLIQNSSVTIADTGAITITTVGTSSYTPLLTFANDNATTPMIVWTADSGGNNMGLQFAPNGGIAARIDNSGNMMANTFGPALGSTEAKYALNFMTLQQRTVGTGTPSVNFQSLYFKTDSNLYMMDHTGVEVQVNGGSSGANTTLSNLGTTSINSALIPASDNTVALGTVSHRWTNAFLNTSVQIGENGEMFLRSNATTPSSASVAGISTESNDRDIAVYSSNNNNSNSTATFNVRLETGNKTAGTGNSGDFFVQSGTSSGGHRGSFKLSGTNLVASNRGTAPSIDPDPTALGPTGTASIFSAGSDMQGYITVQTDADAASGNFCEVTFNNPYPNGCVVILNAFDNTTADLLSSGNAVWANGSNTGFTAIINGAGFAPNTSYEFQYIVIGY